MKQKNCDNNILGNIIKTVRKNKGLTQEALGRLVGLRKTSISKMENGITNVSVDDASILLEAMGEKLEVNIAGHTLSSEKTKQQIHFIAVAICWFADAKNISTKDAYDYLLKHRGIYFLEENYEYEQTRPKDTIVSDLTQICNDHVRRISQRRQNTIAVRI